ncbi:hypothetical protein MAPG_10758 [Magnaporthiopsis poae ATCC 64411]|uniref:Heterokaryon incompatibility domain-containing protein n=1 Tax=Magnaporthiopsis poae (strain ATCC 64411 / 73-15) TaxID=644358 RepID=A0A0C4EDG0_MAGP6|nr:hypothetical protein MAPG_10758 [Magnaporthiopsis poae ATCC 64411]
MSRWHTALCDEEEGGVQVEVGSDGLPRCRNCASSPDLGHLLRQAVADGPALQIPPDEPPGRLNLSWPPTVPYLRSESAGAADSPQQHSATSPASNPQIDIGAAPFSPVYRKTLRSDEFRLLVLDSRETPTRGADAEGGWPVHFELETYNDSDCPEYEAVSYVWGGEEGDSSPCRPVYVGPFWDVLFQTRNCYDMLRLLRPTRGIRLLWVDAICINQNDVCERDQQVAKMAFIYGHAWRVVLYLGPDMVSPLQPSATYPARSRLEELGPREGQPIFPDLRLEDVLERRYFRRVWVVQELLLAKQVLVRIRDMEFVADQRTSANLLRNGRGRSWTWRDTSAPWLAHVSHGVAKPDELLRVVVGCQATDPRDSVFGILGLLDPSLSLVPNYLISAAHARIGFVAHCLLNGRMTGVLLHPGPRNTGMYPSWVPWPASGEAAWRTPTREIEDAWVQRLEQHYLESRVQPRLQAFITSGLPGMPERQWHKDAHVDASTGSLSIRLTHLMTIYDVPVKLSTQDGFVMLLLKPPAHFYGYAKCWEFCLIFQESPHDLDLRPGADHVFILYDDRLAIILIMRQSCKGSPRFRLVACCHQIYIATFERGIPYFSDPLLDARNLHRSILEYNRMFPLRNRVRDFFTELKHPASPITRPRPASPSVLQGIFNDECGASPSFVDAFSKAYSQLSPQRITLNHTEYLELLLSPFNIGTIKFIFDPPAINVLTGPPSYWRRDPPSTLKDGPATDADGSYQILDDFTVLGDLVRREYTADADTVASLPSLFVRLPVEKLKEWFRTDELVALSDLRKVGHGRRLDIGQMWGDQLALFFEWASGLYPAPPDATEYPDYLFVHPHWPAELVEAFGIDGSTYQVTIE